VSSLALPGGSQWYVARRLTTNICRLTALQQKRLFYVITTLITITAAISYFAMAVGEGVSIHKIHVREQHDHVPGPSPLPSCFLTLVSSLA
jgi:hypothetical protein